MEKITETNLSGRVLSGVHFISGTIDARLAVLLPRYHIGVRASHVLD